MFAITAVLGAVAVTLFVFQVLLSVVNTKSSGRSGELLTETKDGTVETLGSVGDVSVGVVRLVGSVIGILSLNLLIIVLLLLGTTALGIGIANYGDEMSGAFDVAFTATWPPLYRGVVLAIVDPVLSLWDIIIPVANSINGSWKIFRSNVL